MRFKKFLWGYSETPEGGTTRRYFFNLLTLFRVRDIFCSSMASQPCSGGHVDRLPSGSVSELLGKWQAGDPEALRALVPLVYADLRRLARYHRKKERPDHTLQSTALCMKPICALPSRKKYILRTALTFLPSRRN